MTARFIGVLSACVVLGVCAGAVAQTAPDMEQEARAKFSAGREAINQGDVKKAFELFGQSLALKRAPGTLLNLADCEQRLGLSASATAHYREVTALIPDTDERAAIARERIAALEPHVPALRVRLGKGALSGTMVRIGERVLAANELDTFIPLDPGTYVISASAAVGETMRYEVVLEDGHKVTHEVSPLAAAPVAIAPAAPVLQSPPVAQGRLVTAGFVTLSVAGAAAVGGAISGGMAMAKQQGINERCPGSGPRVCDPALQAERDSGKAFADVSTAMFVVAGVALAGGMTMVVLGRRKAAMGPEVSLGIGAGSVSLGGRF